MARAMDCPGGDGRLKAVHIASLRLHRCPDCGGTWYDKDQLSVLKDRESAGDYRWIDIDLWRHPEKFRAARQRRSECPRDGTPLTTVHYGDSKILVDICERCEGVWLDKNEYRQIIAYLDEVVDTESLRDYLRDFKDEFVEIFSGPEGIGPEIKDLDRILYLLELRFAVEHPRLAAFLRGLPTF